MPQIHLPNSWSPREHQAPLYEHFVYANSTRGLRGLAVWHRRAGKDATALHTTAVMAHKDVGTYWHLLPNQVQAKKVIWNETWDTPEGPTRIIDQVFPEEIRSNTNASDLSIRLKCGSLWQLGGSDNYNSLVGSNVRGVVFSEWSLCDPQAWAYIRPILRQNGGWAMFIYTPRGRNHGWDLFERNVNNPRWHASLKTVDDTYDDDTLDHIITPQDILEEQEDGMSKEMIDQEYYCSFAAGVVGAYFARQLEAAREQGRIGRVPYNNRLPVHTYWDIGIDDATAVWFGQRYGYERRWFRYEEWKDVPLIEVYRQVAQMPYRYALHNFPHDAGHRNPETGRIRIEYAEDIFEGKGQPVVVLAYDKQDQIEAGRALIDQSWFDETGCRRGLEVLLNYAKKWDEKTKAYLLTPNHNWASHGSDAWMVAGVVDIDEPVVGPGQVRGPVNNRVAPPDQRRRAGKRRAA